MAQRMRDASEVDSEAMAFHRMRRAPGRRMVTRWREVSYSFMMAVIESIDSEDSVRNLDRIWEKMGEKEKSCNARESKRPNVSDVVCESDTRLSVACDKNS